MATRPTAIRFRKESAVPLPRHRASTFFPTLTPLRVKYVKGMGRPSPHDTPPKARPRVVADNARHAQRALNLQANRDGVSPRRLK
jgi:hypothetical protein